MQYDFYKSPLFRVYTEIEDGHMRMKTSGVASILMRKTLEKNLSIFEGEKPAKVEADRLICSTWMPPVPSQGFDRLVKSQIYSMLGKMVPDQVTISVTEECPNNCIHCALPDTKNRKKLAPEIVKSTIDQVLEMGTTFVIFDGGEPLTYPGLENLIRYVNPEKAITGMFTSGVGMTEERASSLKEAGLYSLTVSFDSAYEDKHDHVRGRKGVFKSAVEAVKNGIKAGLLVNIYVVLSRDNVNELEELYALSSELGVHELSFYEIVPTGRWIDHASEIMTPKDLKKFENFVSGAREKEGPRIFPIPLVMNTTGCMAGRKWLHITPEGNILPCACIPISYGNVHRDRIKDIWKKIREDPAYNAKCCLMRNPEFREKYLSLSE
ncbi:MULTISPECIES: radical SAM protein [Methanosarcina]|uniref:Radical SAM domain protein n=3 Tax=Methanosarcina barkeri TaxID=2208 RepID=A0A0E3QXH5_METBA|nr:MULTISPECIES: radical SAM protein [Methanosarcina]AKB56345.1 radical SAM domain protein [Methanosarcina barkeri MS]AKB59816.1 radical SAM domain protein [Methanosarcina barkeri 227]AKJ40467.1 radical SAM domain-containing protein [Methanosarcina barkeri CM1]OEC90288.1 molybdenum cofactor biosynthesis protein MoaA [Methanosarcina sp. A14]